MKRLLFSLMLVAMLTILPSGCLGKKQVPVEPAQSQPTAAVQTMEPTYEIACEIFPPFSYEEDGQVKGIFIDLVREAFKRMDEKVVITAYPWNRAITMLENGNTDALCTIYKTAERETFTDYSQPVVPDIQVLFVRKESDIKFDGNLNSVAQYTIGTVEGYSYGETFDTAFKAGTLKSDPVNLVNRNVEKLLSGRIDMYIEGKYVALYTMKNMGVGDKVKALSPDVRNTQLYLGFSKKRNLTPLIEKFNVALQEMKQDGTYQKIVDAYAN